MKKNRWILEKTFTFDAAHKLENMPAGHKCGNLHGHTWTVIVRIASTHLHMPQQWVIDFGDMKTMIKPIIDQYDHQFLNNQLPDNPTCEIIAMALYREIAKALPPSKVTVVDSITVYETAGNGCTFRCEETAD